MRDQLCLLLWSRKAPVQIKDNEMEEVEVAKYILRVSFKIPELGKS